MNFLGSIISSLNTELLPLDAGVRWDNTPNTYSWIPIIAPVLINVTGLVFYKSTYNRKSSTEIKINSAINFFLEQYV